MRRLFHPPRLFFCVRSIRACRKKQTSRAYSTHRSSRATQIVSGHASVAKPRPCLTVTSTGCCVTSTRARNGQGRGAPRRRPHLPRLLRPPRLPRLSSPCLPPSCWFQPFGKHVRGGTFNSWHDAQVALLFLVDNLGAQSSLSSQALPPQETGKPASSTTASRHGSQNCVRR